MKASIVVEKDEYGYYAFCPEMKGCHTQGDSLDEVLANMKEAVELYVETLSEEEKGYFLSKEILTTSMEVNVKTKGHPLCFN
ncbi:type II toxin-antitoxin system HicB family antitoxin [Candidatus Thiosymbion oneisti]|uniref:type II toxin-antitoxin system HicB family antitoxin n=1 Tax=Candidatus Thiosymbion oneisti TaxID=589554 RepID=UPI00105D1CD6|nr:type II toxin-antitoxin system HicB family antitoxin [Candidatus Thiosymbion oneisti]